MKIIRGATLQFEPASHEDPKNPGVLKKVLLKRPDFIQGHMQMVNWALLPKGHSFQLHYHETLQEIFVMLSGKVKATIEGKETELEKGDALVVDMHEKHEMENISDADVEYIVFGISQGESGKTVVVS